jgi:hypothetical protein
MRDLGHPFIKSKKVRGSSKSRTFSVYENPPL